MEEHQPPTQQAAQEIPAPSAFTGNFRAYVEFIRNQLEGEYSDDPGPYASVEERAELEAQFIAARNWLVERWGEHSPCPICENIEWTVSGVAPAIRPAGYHSFFVTCGFCGNSMQVVPGIAQMATPRRLSQQLEFPGQ